MKAHGKGTKMKKLSKKLSILLALAIMLTGVFGMPIATAEENQDPNAIEDIDIAESMDSTSLLFEEPISIDLSGYTVEEELTPEPTLGDFDNDMLKPKGENIGISGTNSRQSNANLGVLTPSRNPFNYVGSIAIADDYDLYGVYSVAPGGMIEAIMYAPAKSSVQYELQIYEYPAMNFVDFSSFGTGGNIDFESVGVINNTGSQMFYAVCVYALTNGNGNDTYDLTVAVSSGYDNYEANNSFYETAYNRGVYTVPYMRQGQQGQSYSFSGSLHSPVDVDYFVFSVPSNARYMVFYFTENNTANVNYQLFHYDNWSLTELTKDSEGEYLITPGEIYCYRISSVNSGASYPRNYSFQLRTYIPSASAVITGFTVNSNPVPTQIYSQGGQRYAFLQSGQLQVTVEYYTASGALNYTEDDIIIIIIENRAWSNPDLYWRENFGNAVGGVARTPLTIGLVYGQVTVNQQYGFFLYDYSVTFYIDSANYNVLDTSMPVFATTRIN